jgi:acyl-CoA reductase-like NAD-dependent aldehyde dehydrogenase
MTEKFTDVRNQEGKILRRTPCCGKEELLRAQASACEALPLWEAKPASERRAFLVRWGAALQTHAAHFAHLLVEETRKSEAAAAREVAAAIALLISPETACGDHDPAGGRIVACAWGRRHPLTDAVRQIAPVLAAGSVVIANPCATAPGAAFALCELSARVGAPPGILNLVYASTAKMPLLRGTRGK